MRLLAHESLNTGNIVALSRLVGTHPLEPFVQSLGDGVGHGLPGEAGQLPRQPVGFLGYDSQSHADSHFWIDRLDRTRAKFASSTKVGTIAETQYPDALACDVMLTPGPLRFEHGEIDKHEGESHFAPMRWTNPVRLLLRALALAAVGFVLAAGAAAAHERYIAAHAQERHSVMQMVSPGHHSDGYARPELPSDMAVQTGNTVRFLAYRSGDVALALHEATLAVEPGHSTHSAASDAPCSENRADGDISGSCCTMACHAALPTSRFGPPGNQRLSGLRVAGLTNMLVGRSNDRAERPPRIG